MLVSDIMMEHWSCEFRWGSNSLNFTENKGWELVKEAKREGNEIAAAMADSIYFSSPEARASFKKPEAPKA